MMTGKLLMKKLKANLVLSWDFKSIYKNIWIGCLLITWTLSHHKYRRITELRFIWYGLDYWTVQEIECENNEEKE